MPDGSNTPTRSIRLREWQTVSPRSPEGAVLRGLRLTDRESALADELSGSGRLIIRELARGLEITCSSHVGRVRLGPLTITVDPKIEGDQLLELVRYAYGLRDLRLLATSSYSAGGPLLIDLLVKQLHAEVSELARRGLVRAYERRARELESPRGSIDIARLASRGGLTRASLPCVTHDRVEDWTLNRLLVSGLRLAATLTGERPLVYSARRLAADVGHGWQRVELTGARIARARQKLTRLTRAYGPALHLIEMLYQHKLPALDPDDAATALPGFLFDMNRCFQALLARFLGDHLTGHDVRAEAPLRGLLRYHREANPRRRRDPLPKPDFTVLRRGRTVALLDAKYRDLWTTPLPREMLYQLVLYAISQGVDGEAVILYPSTDANARDAKIEIRVPSSTVSGSGSGRVILRPVQLSLLLSAVTTGTPAPGQLAEALAFGRKRP